jgi:hypothetical protein
VVFSVGKGMTHFMSLGMLVAGENDSQSFWGLDLEIMLLRAPFLIPWEVTMAQPVCIFHVVYLTNAQGGEFLSNWTSKGN